MSNNLRQKAHELIKNKIATFELKPGDVLSEAILAKELAIGRTPVREALLMLENEKLVECKANVGYVVRRLTPSEAEDYYGLREALEQFAAPLIIERISKESIERLKVILAESERHASLNDIRGVAVRNTEFHAELYKAAQSQAFIDVIFQVMEKLRWFLAIAVANKSGPSEALADHHRMLDAIERKNLPDLREEIRIHLEHAREKYFSVAAMLF